MSSQQDNPFRLPIKSLSSVDDICLDFEAEWRNGNRPRVVDFLHKAAASERSAVLSELLLLDIDYRCRRGEVPSARDYYDELPLERDVVDETFSAAQTATSTSRSDTLVPVRTASLSEGHVAAPEHIGRYRIVEKLNAGGFGTVYKGFDTELERQVAIKVPKLRSIGTESDVDMFLAEARLIANLNHPRIVPVHDVGRLDDGTVYLVSKFMDGGDLAAQTRRQRPRYDDAARIVAEIADALDFAHDRGIVHRDVKLSNIVIDNDGNVALADFGLALPDLSKTDRLVGTPMAMSPEQARGEGHLIGRRTDVYSLGVVLYELLTGKRPFASEDILQLLDDIQNRKPTPPRQLDSSVPAELERITIRALEKRASDRFATAAEMAAELRAWITHQQTDTPLVAVEKRLRETDEEAVTVKSGQVIPKGLRAYDESDRGFFLQMIPGPRNQVGLPQSVLFWKSRIESTDPAKAFRVGLLYGPSGSGKSSLIKAALLPNLASHVRTVYIEAKPTDTEAQLLARLRGIVGELPKDLDLVAALRWIREFGVRSDRKIILILDQFEQWLHVNTVDPTSSLGMALRHCDGVSLQCLLLVRDDFWMPVARFMRQLEIPLREGRNCAAADLFDREHATSVLSMLGRAFGRLPTAPDGQSKKHARFLEEATMALGEDGRIVPLHLSLFAEMVKSKPWEPRTLQAVGGTEGLGVRFLEETFSAGHRSPAHRYHHAAARAVLSHLLYSRGDNLRGGIQHTTQLRQVSGYKKTPRRFIELLDILDGELRLITPVDPEGIAAESGEDMRTSRAVEQTADDTDTTEAFAREGYYQLTHDFLVPSIREWLERERMGTMAGRAEARLRERAEIWGARPETKYLPGFLEWLRIRALTKRNHWNEKQHAMMETATRHHVLRTATLLIAVMVFGGLAFQWFGRSQAMTRVNALLAAHQADVPQRIEELRRYQRWAEPLLQSHAETGDKGDPKRLRAVLGLLAHDTKHVDFALEALLHAEPREFSLIRHQLSAHQQQFVPQLWKLGVAKTAVDPKVQFRAACALAAYDTDNSQHAEIAPRVADLLVSQDPGTASYWFDALRPIGSLLRNPIKARVRNQRNAQANLVATSALLDLCAVDVQELVELIPDMNAEQIQMVLPKLHSQREQTIQSLQAQLLGWEKDQPNDAAWPDLATSVSRRIEAAHGMVNQHFALFQTLPIENLESMLESLRESSYRPLRVRPFVTSGKTLVSAVFTRDAKPWRIRIGRTAAQVSDDVNQLREAGFAPLDVAGYQDRSVSAEHDTPTGSQPGARFVVLWEPLAANCEVAAYAGLSPDEHNEHWQKLKREESFSVISRHLFLPGDGEVSHSAVWRRPGPERTYLRRGLAGSYSGFIESLRERKLVLQDTCISAHSLSDFGWTGVAWPDARTESTELHGIDADHHLSEAKALTLQSFRPVSISAAQLQTDAAPVWSSVWHRPASTFDAARRRANIAATLFAMGAEESVIPLMENQQDVTRMHLIELLGQIAAEDRLAAQLDTLKSPLALQAVILALGAKTDKTSRPAMTNRLRHKLTELYRTHPHSAVHAAVKWIASQRTELDFTDQQLPSSEDRQARTWFVNSQGKLFNVVTSSRDPERLCAIADTETTVREFTELRPGHPYMQSYSPAEDCPINSVSWLDAAAYCRALNEKEGIPQSQWCYLPSESSENGAWLIPADHTIRTGYRLVTLDEMQQVSGHFLTEATLDNRLYGQYAWLVANSTGRTHRTASKLPNPKGFFDLHGNVTEWLHEPYDDNTLYPRRVDDTKQSTHAGGHYRMSPWELREDAITSLAASSSSETMGLRIARTLKPSALDHHQSAHNLARTGQWERAADLKRQALELRPSQVDWRFDLGRLYLYLGKHAEYQQQCDELLRQYRASEPVSIHEIALLVLATPTDREVANAIVESIEKLNSRSRIVQRSYANALFRAGHMQEAEEAFRAVTNAGLVLHSQAANELSKATFRLAQGKTELARQHREHALALLEQDAQTRPDGDYGDDWGSWVSVQNLLKQLGELE